MSKTGFICTAYFMGRDGKGTCDTCCQWWNNGCPCAKGSGKWDGKDNTAIDEGRLHINLNSYDY